MTEEPKPTSDAPLQEILAIPFNRAGLLLRQDKAVIDVTTTCVHLLGHLPLEDRAFVIDWLRSNFHTES